MESATPCATPHATTRTVGIREAARALGKSPSTIGRYVKAHPEINRGSEGRPKVDLDELIRHREATVNPFQSGSHAGQMFGEVNGAANGHADIPLAVEYDRAHNAGKKLQQDLVDLAALLGRQLEAMTEPWEIVALLRTDYLRILTTLASSLRSDVETEAEEAKTIARGDVAPLPEPQR